MTGRHAPTRAQHRILLNIAAPVAFFLSYHLTNDLTFGTWCQIGVGLLSVAVGWWVNRRIEPFPLLLAIVAGLMSALSLAFHAPLIVKLESSIPHLVIGLVLLGGISIGYHPLRNLLPHLDLPRATWRRLSLISGGFALLISVANLIVATTMPDRYWVTFKFPIMPLLHVGLVFLLRPMIRAGRRQAASARVQ